jgi:hypothetical protein
MEFVMFYTTIKDEMIRFPARLPAPVLAWLKQEAERNLRSRNAELIYVLMSRMEADQAKAGAA